MTVNLADKLKTGERAASEAKTEQRVRLDEEPRDIITSSGEIVGTFAIGTYSPRKGEPVPVVVERIGSTERMIGLVTLRAAAQAYADGFGLAPVKK